MFINYEIYSKNLLFMHDVDDEVMDVSLAF